MRITAETRRAAVPVRRIRAPQEAAQQETPAGGAADMKTSEPREAGRQYAYSQVRCGGCGATWHVYGHALPEPARGERNYTEDCGRCGGAVFFTGCRSGGGGP